MPQPAAADEVESYRAAGFWRRLAAGLIDLAVILPISLALAWSVGAITGLSLPAASQSALDYWIDLVLEGEPALVSVGLLLVCIFCAYSLVFLVTLGRTLGGIAVKTRIIDVYGGRPGVPRALARTLGCVLSACTLGLGFLWIAADPQRRSLHDWLSGTHTIRT